MFVYKSQALMLPSVSALACALPQEQGKAGGQGESVNKLLNFSDRDKPRQLHKHALFSLKITVPGVGAALAAARRPARRYDF